MISPNPKIVKGAMMFVQAGNRKFIAFILALFVYAGLITLVVFKMPQLVVDLSVFAVQLSFGLVLLSGAFLTSNVFEHFANRKKLQETVESVIDQVKK